MNAPDALEAKRTAMRAELAALGERVAAADAARTAVRREAAAKVKPARKLDLTQEEIAQLLQTARGTVAEWEKPEGRRWERGRGRSRRRVSVDAA